MAFSSTTTPDHTRVHQLVLGDKLALRRCQHTKNVERPTPKLHGYLVARQLAPPQVEPESTEADFVTGHRIRPQFPQLQNT
jgi:hypothetical protein